MIEKKLYIAYDPIYAHPLPEGHRFPMVKYELIPQQLIYTGAIQSNQLFSPAPCKEEIILLTHTKEYLDKLLTQTLSAKEQRAIGFPQSEELTLRELIITQGTIDCCELARKNGIAMNVAGGTHHAFSDKGEGFCLLNDFAVAANHELHSGKSKKILIVDLDVHQGNGTASIFQKEERVFTFSMHGKHNYPFHKMTSDMDIPLEDGTTTEQYLNLLNRHLPNLIDEVEPDLCFYLSGVDILETDKFGKLKVNKEGCKERDRIVFQSLKRRSIPCVTAMGGGYSPKVSDILEAHCNTFLEAISAIH